MQLSQLIKDLSLLKAEGTLTIEISGIAFDSRQVTEGSLFVAIPGTQVNGHHFIDQAVKAGAAAVLLEQWPVQTEPGVTYLQVTDSAEALGWVSRVFFNNPSARLKLVGVTGTNGKTTTVTLLYDLFMGLGYKCGLLSTVENRIAGRVLTSTHTTPDVVGINQLLAEMVESGCDYVFMEVSSHAVDQRRIAGLQFAGGVFTNMSHDHLDYHKTFAAYIAAKKKFFDDLDKSAFALVNVDDKRGTVMVQNTKARVYQYSLRQLVDFKAKIIENSLLGLQLQINGREVYTRFIGTFNAYNLLAAYGVAVLLDQDADEVLAVMSALRAAEGRFDYFRSEGRKVVAIVDYSHTPDALEKILSTLRDILGPEARVITVVGCGGDRDREKRPKMARIAVDYSRQVILTSDNPRTEDPDAIIREMEQGIPAEQVQHVLSITNRREAIRTACRLAQPGDVILVAGKGHEKYQEINGVKHPFDDKAVLKEELAG